MTSSVKTLSGRFWHKLSVHFSSAIGGRNALRSIEGKPNRHSIAMESRRSFIVISNQATSSLMLTKTPNWATSALPELWTRNQCMPRHMLEHLITWARSRSTSRSTTRRATSGHLAASSMRWLPWDHHSKPRTNLHWLWRSRKDGSNVFHSAILTTSGAWFKSCCNRTRVGALP